MTSNSAMKAAARAYQKANPGVPFPEALRIVDTRVPLQCPTWCKDHHEPTDQLPEPGQGASHYSAEQWFQAEAGEPYADEDLQLYLQLVSHDQYRARSTTIDLVLPEGEYTAMDAAQAHRVADLLTAGADQLGPVPAIGVCPSWCVEHPDPEEFLPDRVTVHYGPNAEVPAWGARLPPTARTGVRLRASDYGDIERVTRLALIVPGEQIGLSAAAARTIAEALRVAAGVCDSPATTTNSISRQPR